MKQGKKPTRRQKNLIQASGLNPNNWLVIKNLPTVLIINHRHTTTTREIRKGVAM